MILCIFSSHSAEKNYVSMTFEAYAVCNMHSVNWVNQIENHNMHEFDHSYYILMIQFGL